MYKQGLFYTFSLFSAALLFSGCNSNLNIIDGVQVLPEPNLETVKVQLNFGSLIQSDLGGSYAIKDYGTIEIDPWTKTTPFSVGFRFNTSVFNDQDLINLEPVITLPSGQPIPIPNLNRAFVRLKIDKQINPNFDVYEYVDIIGGEWIGVALTLKILNNKVFPSGLDVSERFLNDKSGNPQVVGSFFGPEVDSSGNMTNPGGIALFANVRSIIANSVTPNSLLATAKSALKTQKFDGKYYYHGPLAKFYETHPAAAQSLGVAFKETLNRNSSRGK